MAEDEVMEDVEEQYIPEGGIRIGDIYIPPPPAPACTFDSTGPRLEFPSCLITSYYFKNLFFGVCLRERFCPPPSYKFCT